MTAWGSLIKSRKFWLMMFDLIVSVTVFFVTKYAGPAYADDALFLIGVVQAPILFVIMGITVEDAAQKLSGRDVRR